MWPSATVWLFGAFLCVNNNRALWQRGKDPSGYRRRAYSLTYARGLHCHEQSYMSAGLSVLLSVVIGLQAVLAPLNTPTVTLPCVSGLERADRQSVGKDGFPSIHTEPESYFVTGCSGRGSWPFRQPSLSSPVTLQQWRVTHEEKYDPRRAAAGQSLGTLTAEESSVFTGETKSHNPLYQHQRIWCFLGTCMSGWGYRLGLVVLFCVVCKIDAYFHYWHFCEFI